VCVGGGTTHEAWLTSDLEALGLPESTIYFSAPDGVSVVAMGSDLDCAQAVALGREDFAGYVTSQAMLDFNRAADFPVRQLGTAVFSEDLAAAFDKSSTFSTQSLRAEVDRILRQLKSDGTLSALSNKWFGTDLTSLSFQ
jgi:polar amino acid transport system substrate-binding protein